MWRLQLPTTARSTRCSGCDKTLCKSVPFPYSHNCFLKNRNDNVFSFSSTFSILFFSDSVPFPNNQYFSVQSLFPEDPIFSNFFPIFFQFFSNFIPILFQFFFQFFSNFFPIFFPIFFLFKVNFFPKKTSHGFIGRMNFTSSAFLPFHVGLSHRGTKEGRDERDHRPGKQHIGQILHFPHLSLRTWLSREVSCSCWFFLPFSLFSSFLLELLLSRRPQYCNKTLYFWPHSSDMVIKRYVVPRKL